MWVCTMQVGMNAYVCIRVVVGVGMCDQKVDKW